MLWDLLLASPTRLHAQDPEQLDGEAAEDQRVRESPRPTISDVPTAEVKQRLLDPTLMVSQLEYSAAQGPNPRSASSYHAASLKRPPSVNRPARFLTLLFALDVGEQKLAGAWWWMRGCGAPSTKRPWTAAKQ